MITSTGNPKIKWVRRLQSAARFRRDQNAFVVEGDRWLKELASSNVQPQLVLATKSWLDSNSLRSLLDEMGQTPLVVSPSIMAHASDTKTPPGVLLVAPLMRLPWPVAPGLLLILDGLANPGNLGSLLRTAAAAGADGVLLGPGSVDPFNPKALRGGMGAQLRLPLRKAGWSEIQERAEGMAIWLAAVDGETGYDQIDWQQPAALIIGGEASGASRRAKALAAGRISIPMARATESLNAAAAGAIILFEAARQRRSLR